MDVPAVFVLQHSYDLDGCDETKFIGVYGTREAAEAALARLQTAPGFHERPHDFSIERYELDRDHWGEGFTTVRE
jgi:hypothetical protein